MNFSDAIMNAKNLAKNYFGERKEYELQFNHEEDNCWYIDFPNWGFSHHNLMMVSGADDLCAFLSDDDRFAYVKVIPAKKEEDHPGYAKLVQKTHSLFGGSTYQVTGLEGFDRDIWLCPVTLFVLGEYPKYIYLKKNEKPTPKSDSTPKPDNLSEANNTPESDSTRECGSEPKVSNTPKAGSTSEADNTSKADAVKSETSEASKPSADGKKAHIYNLIIVDESGSMYQLREATMSGVNETVSTIRSAQEEFADTQEHFLTLVTFDSGSHRPDVRTLIDCLPIGEVKDFNDYMPSGCTPLYDAMGQSLSTLHARIKDDDDATAVVTVLTDGLENSSHEWNAHRLRQLIEQLKEQGWSFSYMGSAHNVKEVTDLLAIENVVEFSHDQLGASSTWEREQSSRRSYYRKMGEIYSSGVALSKEEMLKQKMGFAESYYENRITPDRITSLQPNEVFVFGSNAQGNHGGGAAAFAMRNFGAVWGQGEGMQGQSYAIPTMEGIDSLQAAVWRFIDYADSHPDKRFLVTRVGCGIAGYHVDEIAPLFKPCIKLENVSLPADFWKVLGLDMGFNY